MNTQQLALLGLVVGHNASRRAGRHPRPGLASITGITHGGGGSPLSALEIENGHIGGTDAHIDGDKLKIGNQGKKPADVTSLDVSIANAWSTPVPDRE